MRNRALLALEATRDHDLQYGPMATYHPVSALQAERLVEAALELLSKTGISF